MAKAARGSDQFMLRLPDGMREHIKAAADLSGRSMNAEIIARLDESFNPIAKQPMMVVRLEALPEGSEPIEVSVGSFLQSFDAAIKASISSQMHEVQEDEGFERAPDGLQDPIEE